MTNKFQWSKFQTKEKHFGNPSVSWGRGDFSRLKSGPAEPGPYPLGASINEGVRVLVI